MKIKKDLLIVTEQFYPSSATDSILMTQLAEDLDKTGISVGILTSKLVPKEKGRLKSNDSYKNISIKRIRSINLRGKSTIFKIINKVSLMISSFFYVFHFRKYKIALCLSTPPLFPVLGVFAKKLCKTKLIFLLYDLYPDVAVKMKLIKDNGLSYKLTDSLYRTVYKNSDTIIALGRDAKEYLVKNKNANEEKIKIITNWQDESKVGNKDYDLSFAKKHGLDNSFVLTYSGNMGLFHDLETIVDFAKSIEKAKINVKIALCGKGDKKASIVDLVKKYDLKNIILFDFLSLDEYNSLMSISNAFFVTLLPGVEGLSVPSKTYAYMLAGKPIISIMDPNAEISIEVLESKAGFCIRNGDVKGLRKAVTSMISNKKLYEELKKNSRGAGCNKYERKKVTTQYVELIKKMLK